MTDRRDYFREYNRRKGDRHTKPGRRDKDGIRSDVHRMVHRTMVGIDGEGQGRKPHLYTYMAAVDEHGEVQNTAENKAGLSTIQCVEFLLALATAGHTSVFGFSLGYDYTMMLKDLPDAKLYSLSHEDSRSYTDADGRHRIRPVDWKGYRFNYVNRRLTVRRVRWDMQLGRHVAEGPAVVVWDVFRFYGCKFTEALLNWKVADEKELRWVASMKDNRASFDAFDWSEVKRYCQKECMYLAQLVRRLVDAHESCGLKLSNFYGAGSTAAALMRKMGVSKSIASPPEEARHAIASAFFGGRFEISQAGPVSGRVFNYDISSAYPYQCTRLPCLTHGRWERVGQLVSRIEKARLACIQVTTAFDKTKAWGPFPWRHPKGDITFPISNPGVWVWKDEYLAAVRCGFRVRGIQAWCYDTDCDCRPFADVPTYYRERCQLGKDGAGIVLKLGCNSLYGKTAQHRGSARFQSYVYAGNITSSTRGQLLDMLGAARDPWNVLMMATDGVWSTEPLPLPKPADTGTFDLEKPLGGWETKVHEHGAFLIRPGIYFPLGVEALELKDLKARGVQRSVLLENRARIQEHWASAEWHEPMVLRRGLFFGMKACLTKGPSKRVKRSEDYGQWDVRDFHLSFDPRPKRSHYDDARRLIPYKSATGESTPYNPALLGREAMQARLEEIVMAEQPDADAVRL